MPFKLNKRFLWIGGLIVALVIALTAAGAFILPAYVQSRVIPRLAAGFGLAPGQVRVRRIGLWGVDLGPVQFNFRQSPVITLAAVQIDYTPWSLLQGRIQGIALGGVALSLTVTADGVSVAGLQLPARDAHTPETSAGTDLATLLPIQLDHFTVMQSLVSVDWHGRRHLIPMDVRLDTAGLGRGVLQGRVDFSILGNPALVAVSLDQRANSALLTFECDRFALDSLRRIGLLPVDVRLSGVFGLKGRATWQLNPLKMTGLEVSGRLTDTLVAGPQGRLGNMPSAQGDPQPIDLSVSSQDPSRILFSCGPLEFNGPIKAAITGVTGEWTPGRPGWSLKARAQALIPRQNLESGLILEKHVAMSWQMEAARDAQSAIDFKVLASTSRPLAAGLKSFHLAGEACKIDIAGRYAQGRLEADPTVTTGKLRMALPDGAVTIADAKISGTIVLALPSASSASTIKARAVLSRIRSEMRSAVVTLPEIQISADGRSGPSSPWAFQGRLKIGHGRMQDKAHAVALQGLNLDLPWQWPPGAKPRAGRLDLRTVQWKGRQLGGIKGTLRQQDRTLEANLEHRSKLFAGLRVLVNGRLNSAGIHADMDIPSYRPAQAVDLGRFSPQAAGTTAGGRIEAHSTVEVVNGVTRGRANLKFDQGTVAQDARKISLQGIDLALQINDIAAVKSAPRQKLKVDTLQFGELAAQNLDVDFQLEDRRTLFLEKVGLQWCRGRINTAAIRITQGKEDYDVTLFCDRLNLAMVLEQLGAAEAGGEGTVNGRIPLHWVNGRLSFDNGFLYSTPGQSGQIQLTGTEALLSGMPPGSPQHTQLDIATEALKDYTYQWAKVTVQSDKDILLLKLQLDGKPNRLLPFAYDQQLGQFKRIAGKGQAEFKGISIDLNFKSPLNEIIHYKEFLNRN